MGQYIKIITFVLCMLFTAVSFGQSKGLDSYTRVHASTEKVNTTSVISLDVEQAGSIENPSAALTWSTYDEAKIKRFEIWRSLDGKSYEKVLSIHANGGLKKLKNYEASDDLENVDSPKVYYRIRQVSRHNNFDYVDFDFITLN